MIDSLPLFQLNLPAAPGLGPTAGLAGSAPSAGDFSRLLGDFLSPGDGQASGAGAPFQATSLSGLMLQAAPLAGAAASSGQAELPDNLISALAGLLSALTGRELVPLSVELSAAATTPENGEAAAELPAGLGQLVLLVDRQQLAALLGSGQAGGDSDGNSTLPVFALLGDHARGFSLQRAMLSLPAEPTDTGSSQGRSSAEGAELLLTLELPTAVSAPEAAQPAEPPAWESLQRAARLLAALHDLGKFGGTEWADRAPG